MNYATFPHFLFCDTNLSKEMVWLNECLFCSVQVVIWFGPEWVLFTIPYSMESNCFCNTAIRPNGTLFAIPNSEATSHLGKQASWTCQKDVDMQS